jgi:nitrate/nitrite transporter NarK
MAESITTPASASTAAKASNTGWIVTGAATGINLALGILYTWSVISANIPQSWGWNEADKSWPYSVALLVFAFATIPAGRLQDSIGPRWISTAGGVLVGIGMVLASFTTSPIGFIIGFGVLAGAGIGFGYACATPPAVKWFGKSKTGMITGIVVSGFGLASVYAAPSAEWLAKSFDLPTAMRVFGIAFLVVVVALSQLLKTPPQGYVPDAGANAGNQSKQTPAQAAAHAEHGPGEVLKKTEFYLLWFIYFCGAGAGLMVVSKMAVIAKEAPFNLALGFILVAVLAVGNGGGRILAGIASDRIGRLRTLQICFVLQAILLVVIATATPGGIVANAVILGIIAAIVGGNYGANLAVFPAISKDRWGLKNFGANYGFLFTAWGIGGFVMSQIIGRVHDATGTFTIAYYVAAILLIAGAGCSLLLNSRQK